MTGAAAVPAVMGRAAVLVTASLLGCVGVGQLLGVRVSGVIDNNPSHYLGIVWGVAFVMGLILTILSRTHRDAYLAMVFEVGGIIALVGGLSVYGQTLFAASGGWPKNGTMTVALVAGTSINLFGRGLFVFRSLCRWLIVFRPEGFAARGLHRLGRVHLRVTSACRRVAR